MNLEITNKDNGYTFEARGIEYFIKRNGDLFSVWTRRKSLARSGGVKTMTFRQMAEGSNKTLRAFAELVTA